MSAEATRSDSVISEIVTADGPAIVKRHRAEADLTRPPAVRARHEFDTLTFLGAKMPDGFTVPRAIELDEGSGSVVMARASGASLDALMREQKRLAEGAQVLAPAVTRAGAWLRVMQEATASATSPDAALEILHAQVALAARDAAEVYRGRMQRRVAEALHDLERAVAERPLQVCGHHGDYWPGNVLLDRDRVTVIDFEGYRQGLPMEDVAYFLTQVRLLLPRHGRLVPALSTAFLKGWSGTVRDEELRLFTLTKTLRLLARNAGSQHPFLVALWIRRTLRKTVERCLP